MNQILVVYFGLHCNLLNRINVTFDDFSNPWQVMASKKKVWLIYNVNSIAIVKLTQPCFSLSIIISAAKWMIPDDEQQKKPKERKLPIYFTKHYLINNRKHLIWTSLYILINTGLFLTCLRYRHTNAAVVIARGCGMCLNFNSALLALTMLRHTLTWLRMTVMRYFLPIDNHVSYHRFIGYFCVVLSVVHTVAHLINIGKSVSVLYCQELLYN